MLHHFKRKPALHSLGFGPKYWNKLKWHQFVDFTLNLFYILSPRNQTARLLSHSLSELMLLFGGRIREISLSGKLRPLIARGIESGLWSHHCLLQKTDTHLNLQGGSLQEPIIDSTDNAGIMISHGALYLDEPKTCRLSKASNMYLYIT